MKARMAARVWLRRAKRAGGLVHDQVDVALAVLQLLVLHAVELVGQRAQALGQQAHRRGVDRQLAGLGLEQMALGGHDVAQVPVLEGRVGVLAHVVTHHVDLDAPVVSCSVAKLALPITRLSIMRPATLTAIFAPAARSASNASFSVAPCAWCKPAARSLA
jgi:hypothetical protein